MDYYSRDIFLAITDKDDNTTGKVERWSAHEQGILHRGFTCVLFYDNRVVFQHRKHPAFDGFWDLTFSSHPVYLDHDRLQDVQAAIYQTLQREWNVDENGLKTKPKFLGKIYYKAKDPKSIYTEHEVDCIFSAQLKDKPHPNLNYAYGYEIVEKIMIEKFQIKNKLAPWIKTMLDHRLV